MLSKHRIRFRITMLLGWEDEYLSGFTLWLVGVKQNLKAEDRLSTRCSFTQIRVVQWLTLLRELVTKIVAHRSSLSPTKKRCGGVQRLLSPAFVMIFSFIWNFYHTLYPHWLCCWGLAPKGCCSALWLLACGFRGFEIYRIAMVICSYDSITQLHVLTL